MTGIPTGTVTFLFTDIEGSTRLWQQHPHAIGEALARYNALLHQVIEGRAMPLEQAVALALEPLPKPAARQPAPSPTGVPQGSEYVEGG